MAAKDVADAAENAIPWATIIGTVGSGISSYMQSRQQRDAQERAISLSREEARLIDKRTRDLAALDDDRLRDLALSDDARVRDLALQELALRESDLDPFRHQRQQAGAISWLDLLERADFTPTTIEPNAAYAQYAPQVTRGGGYTPSPEMRQSAAALKKNVMAGHGAPTMTNPQNYGKTSALDLISVLAGAANPASASSFRTGVPLPGESPGERGLLARRALGASDVDIVGEGITDEEREAFFEDTLNRFRGPGRRNAWGRVSEFDREGHFSNLYDRFTNRSR